MDPATKAIALLVAALTAVGIVHGAAHVMIGAIPPPADLAYIATVVFAAPVASVLLRPRGSRRPADYVLLASMIGSLAYGVGNHYPNAGPDSAWAAPPGAWGSIFQATAALLVAVEILGVAMALIVLGRD